MKNQEQRPRGERRSLPAPPPEVHEVLPTGADGIDAFNARMMAYFNTVSLYTCASCGRSFHSEAYDKHKQRCRGGTASSAIETQAAMIGKQQEKSAPQPPRMFVCYMCGH